MTDYARRQTRTPRRYFPEWEPRTRFGRGRGSEAPHNAYPAGGYAEEFGHEPGPYRNVFDRDLQRAPSPGGRETHAGFPRQGRRFADSDSDTSPSFGTDREAEADADEAMAWRAAGAQDYPGGEFSRGPAGPYRGRGPKGYQRSDELLQERICRRLTQDAYIDASDLSVSVHDREVTFEGTVSDRRTKHAVEDVAELCGAAGIRNRLRVRSQRT